MYLVYFKHFYSFVKKENERLCNLIAEFESEYNSFSESLSKEQKILGDLITER